MKLNTRLSQSLLSALILVLMAALWFTFAPVQFGGQASYIMIAGASMEPNLHYGDLVVAHEERIYEVGDVVTYRHPIIGPVIHRIIERTGDTYQFKGDNNDWIDSYEPTSSELIGKSWIHLPSAANIILKLRSSLGIFLLSFAIGFMVLLTFSRNSLLGKEQPKKDKQTVTKRSMSPNFSGYMEGTMFALFAILLGAILLGVFAFTNPLAQSVPADIPYDHRGTFSYEAVGSPSVYDEGKIKTGDAIFHALTHQFDLTFNYQLSTPETKDLVGSYHILLEVSEPNGWRRQIELSPDTEFQGESFSTEVTINLGYILTLVDRLKTNTALKRQVFNVDIIPEVNVQGNLGDQAFEDTFVPRLSFQLDEIQLYLAGSDPFGEGTDPLVPVQSGFLPRQRQIPATLNILGLKPTVQTARWIAGVTFGVSLLGIAAILYPFLRASMKSPSENIRIQFNEVLLDIRELPGKTTSADVEVDRFEDLAKLAEKTGSMIFHHVEADHHTYLLQEGDITYRFLLTVTEPDDGDVSSPEADETSDDQQEGEEG
ncbi:MAG: signal peptidase I [Anaerolineales bacterium]|nr:MAG: signal peptidase I [Anaerolineales bacterium]